MHLGRIATVAAICVRAGALSFKLLAAFAFVVPPPVAFAASDQPPYLIDDFEAPTALQNWRFYTRPEPPAAGGGLTLGPGHRGQGAVLAYRLPCERDTVCGAYAAAL